jgi:cytochrome c oxidase subunit 2
MLGGLLAGAVPALWAGAAGAEMRLNFQPQATALGHAIYNLHTIVLLICVVIFVGVFGAMFYSIVYHRKSVGHKAAHFHENTTVELVWTGAVPILIGMAFRHRPCRPRDTSAPDISSGHRLPVKWQYDYLQEGFSHSTATRRRRSTTRAEGRALLLEVDNELVVPVGKRVRVLITAGDVLHAWYVPALAVKQDAIPGFVRDAWFNV